MDSCSVSHKLGTLQTHTTDTFLFISHSTNVLLFKFRCNIFNAGFGGEWDTLYHQPFWISPIFFYLTSTFDKSPLPQSYKFFYSCPTLHKTHHLFFFPKKSKKCQFCNFLFKSSMFIKLAPCIPAPLFKPRISRTPFSFTTVYSFQVSDSF